MEDRIIEDKADNAAASLILYGLKIEAILDAISEGRSEGRKKPEVRI